MSHFTDTVTLRMQHRLVRHSVGTTSGGLVGVVVVWLVGEYWIVPPLEVASAIGTLAAGAANYLLSFLPRVKEH